ncbi:ribosome maturation factor RimM [Carnobacteriaceae bacterium zg-ZUI252]|nr:ribosome maturation factor RimM [Carnobacteriaceae bacterium zg-ZUI252]MBS4770161.1 ribosome maturation factor RimM [Carnobacteriaceae bacterium zg-ZUI240]QTU82755.1 ribosome maturation factor RimM [Carnobacteriaceae bacterium zg-C25]
MAYFNVGKLVNTHGLKGEVRIISITDFADERYQKGQKLALLKDGEWIKDVIVSSHRKHKNFDIVTFEQHPSINDVEQYKGLMLAIDENYLTDLEDDTYYYHEIIGLEVYVENEFIGKVKEILELGSNDVWVVQRQKQKDALIPFIHDVVLEVDIANNRVQVANIEGLLD